MARLLRRGTNHIRQTAPLPIDLRERLETAVRRDNLSASEIIRRALDAYLRRQEKKASRKEFVGA